MKTCPHCHKKLFKYEMAGRIITFCPNCNREWKEVKEDERKPRDTRRNPDTG